MSVLITFLTLLLVLFSQLFVQQTLEDGPDPTLKWALDREILDEEEPD